MRRLLILAVLAATPAAAEPAKPIAGDLGAAVFTNCSGCHGRAGEGRIGPRLRGNPRLGLSELVTRKVLDGSPRMPGFRDVLSPRDLTALLDHLRTLSTAKGQP